jgi:hypothetical protein
MPITSLHSSLTSLGCPVLYLTVLYCSMNGVHNLQYELGWRQLADTSRTASRAVLAQTGDYLKAAARWV